MESVLAQDCRFYEWIVIDGGSTDGSLELIEQNHDKITYWVSEADGGIYEAMNKGVDVSTGDYLQFLNSGDCLANSSIISSFIEKQFQSDIIYGNAIIVDEKDKMIEEYYAPDFVRLSYFWSHSLNHQSSFFHKRCFKQFRYNEQNKIASDTELFMQLLYYGYTFEKWDRFVERFEIGGLSSLESYSDEFNDIVNRLLPSGVKADYEEIIQNRDVDLYILIRRIIASKRWVRNLARLALFPFRLFLN
jgi:glycosyltransferase involved in cell wall biosynthesis